VKELRLKLHECGKGTFCKEIQTTYRTKILMNLKTPYGILCLEFHASWASKKEEDMTITWIIYMVFKLGDRKSLLMMVKFRISNRTISLKKIIDRTIENEVKDMIHILMAIMLNIVLTKLTIIHMMMIHHLIKVRR
jgi:hypothetical protein